MKKAFGEIETESLVSKYAERAQNQEVGIET